MDFYAPLKAELEGDPDSDTKYAAWKTMHASLHADVSVTSVPKLTSADSDSKDDRKPLITHSMIDASTGLVSDVPDVGRDEHIVLAQSDPAMVSSDHQWDGHPLPSAVVQVVVLRYTDIKRKERARKQAQTMAAAAAIRREGREPSVSVQENVPPDGQAQMFVKAEPSDDIELKPRNLLELDELPVDPLALRAAVEDLKNPNVRVKTEMQLSDEFLLDALTWEGLNHRYPIPVPPEIAEFPFRRDYISNLYGGNTQESSPTIAKDRLAMHGLDDWAFLSMAYNPHVPTKAGYSGLAFGGNGGSGEPRVDRTFVGIGPCKWVYMGQYKVERGKPLTAAAFQAQKPIVRRTWARGILRKDWGLNWCASIWLRRGKGVDYEPTKDEWKDTTARIKEIRSRMSEEDIIDAFDRGDEVMWTYRMSCVGYDEEFVRCLARNADRFTPTEKKSKKSRKDTKKEQEKDTGSKRKPIELTSDLKDDAEEHAQALGVGGESGSVSQTRRSSRPRSKRVRSS